MDEQQTVPFDPDEVKTTKTYSMSLGDVARIKEIGKELGLSDASALSKAVKLLYGKVFPESAKVSR